MHHSILFPSTETYKNLADYNIQRLPSSRPEDARIQYLAQEKIKSRVDDPMYSDQWYILMREGKMGAQIEKAVSILYKYFFGYSTDINIIREEKDYYVASRGIKNFTTWTASICNNLIVTQPDGTLFFVQDNTKYPIVGLGALCALTTFFRESDSNTENFGIQIIDNIARAFKIDNEKALNFFNEDEDHSEKENSENENIEDENRSEKENIEDEIRSDSTRFLKQDITKSGWFQKEKQDMLNKIAQTDFSIIENILRENITSTKIESTSWLFNYLLKLPKYENDQAMLSVLDQLKEGNISDQDVNHLIKKLKLDHEGLTLTYQAEKSSNLTLVK
jgi:hypothetical protein